MEISYNFREAHEFITGNKFKSIAESERLDFICVRENGIRTGIELMSVRRGIRTTKYFY